MLQLMDTKLKQVGPVGTPADLIGLQLAVQYTTGFLQILAQDKEQKGTVKVMGQVMAQITNQLKALAQRQQQQAQSQNGGMDATDKAKIQAILMQAQVKAQNAKSSHAEKTAQRRITFEQKFQRDQAKAALDLQKEVAKTRLNSMQ